jgi:transcriptional regulator with XRE-family HTH domain
VTDVLDRAVNAKLVDLWIEQLCTRRHELGLTRQEVARRIGVGRTLLRNWECRVHYPSVANLASWAEALGGDLQMQLPNCERPGASLANPPTGELI